MPDKRTWHQPGGITSKSYVCGHCGEYISSNQGFYDQAEISIEGRSRAHKEYIYICHHCGCPTFFRYDGVRFPGSRYGEDIESIPSQVDELYREARDCFSVNAYTASVMCTRKIIMNVAVDKGADENKRYVEYVEWLDSEGYLPQGSKPWVDRIRDKGNEANHEIPQMTEQDARLMIDFVEMLLKLLYEYPAKATPSGP